MQRPKSSDNLRYFVAISENKRRDLELKHAESKIDDMKKKMLTQYWKDKIGVFDEMIRLNVKTPSYERDRSTEGPEGDNENQMTLGPMKLDSKLLSNRPVTLQRGNKQSGRMEPVISVEGNYAVCYPNKEARKGRRVGLNARVLRRMEQCKTLEDSIASIRNRDHTIEYNDPYGRRPKTAPSKLTPKGTSRQRPATTAGIINGVKNGVMEDSNKEGEDKLNTDQDNDADINNDKSPCTVELCRRPSTSFSVSKREHYLATPALTDLKSSRTSTSMSDRKDR